jgi:hypothetical protein
VSRLTIRRDGNAIAELTYATPEIPDLGREPTAMAEPEDFDFGRKVANVVNDAKRQGVLLERWREFAGATGT